MLDESSHQIAQVVSPDLFRLLVESVMDYAIFLLDPDGNVRSWNAGARRIKGYTADEIIGKHFSIFYPPSEVRRGKPTYGLGVAREAGRWEEEGWRVRKDGSRFWASVIITALRDPGGTLVGFAKVTRDLTERRQAEEERRQLLTLERAARAEAESSLVQLQSIQRVTDAALGHLGLDELLITLLDRIGEVLEVDTVAILLLDAEDGVLVARAAKGIEEEVERGVRIPLGAGFAGRIVSESRPIVLYDVPHAAVLNPILRENGVRSLMGVPLRVEQRVIGVLHVGTLFPRRFTDAEQQLLQIVGDRVALAIDHAQLYEAAQAARQEADISVERLQTQDEFLSIAAHELKTPMTGLKAAVQLLLRRAERSEASLLTELARPLQTINEQTEKLARLTEQLLETARVQADLLPISRQPTDVSALVQSVVARFQEQTTQHHFQVSGPAELWANVDPLRLEQVLSNLLENAIKYSGTAEPIAVELCQPHPRRIQLSVRDYGVGVPPEHRAHLFERFYQVRAGGAQGGLGLGLYISRRIVEQHGGMITADFPPGAGSRFVVALPTDADDDAIDAEPTGS
ncbi:MAG TPA: ATP-binding protein [Nitrolancea sp.]|nr:ATP-binding protein [Nitrolancea sp.]